MIYYLFFKENRNYFLYFFIIFSNHKRLVLLRFFKELMIPFDEACLEISIKFTNLDKFKIGYK